MSFHVLSGLNVINDLYVSLLISNCLRIDTYTIIFFLINEMGLDILDLSIVWLMGS